VIIRGGPAAALAAGAEIAVVGVGSYLEAMQTHFEACLSRGVNVLTIEEETVFPWTSDPARAEALDALARSSGATLAASGAQDVFWLNLVTTLLGAAHRVDRIEGRSLWNVDDYGPEVAGHLRIGEPRETFERYVAEHGWPEFVARQVLEAMAARLGLTVASRRSRVAPATLPEPVLCRALGREVPAGCIVGVVDETELTTIEGPVLSFAMEGRIHRPGETDLNEWSVVGDPALSLRNDAVPYRFVTCSTLINRVLDVIEAPPGLISLDRLGPPGWRRDLRLPVGRA